MPNHSHSASTDSQGNHKHGTVWTDGSYGVWGLYDSASNHRGSGAGNDYDNALPSTSSDGIHTHAVKVENTGGNQTHNNIQPYTVVLVWKRIV